MSSTNADRWNALAKGTPFEGLGDILKNVPAPKAKPGVAEIREAEVEKFRTGKQTYKDLPVGTYVEVIVPMRDFNFFNHERGHVVKSEDGYLSIIVEFDKKYKRPNFNFKPEDLYILGEKIPVRVVK